MQILGAEKRAGPTVNHRGARTPVYPTGYPAKKRAKCTESDRIMQSPLLQCGTDKSLKYSVLQNAVIGCRGFDTNPAGGSRSPANVLWRDAEFTARRRCFTTPGVAEDQFQFDLQ